MKDHRNTAIRSYRLSRRFATHTSASRHLPIFWCLVVVPDDVSQRQSLDLPTSRPTRACLQVRCTHRHITGDARD
ncbi:hypothetical protein RRG08_053836 [Elysia crispata]|uniref:Uncharacterized protein n=1 Tax=Elysia crispata TaxID=231223 RepID=A0AAE1AB60_9GAST|nr:hypothetical protein RRG08_053836 [Elysia crispata]